MADDLFPALNLDQSEFVRPGDVWIVGEIPAEIVREMAWPPACRTVRLHFEAVAHIQLRRGTHAEDAEAVLEHLPNTVCNPHLHGRKKGDRRRIVVVREIEANRRWIIISLKFVPSNESKSGLDEIWVSTGMAIGPKSLTRYRAHHNLRELQEGTES